MIKTKLFPKNGTQIRQIKFLLNYGILAPSGHNSQPWSFVLSDNSVHIKPNFQYSRPQSDPSNRELYISLGAVVTNISIAANYFGLIFQKEYLIDPATKQQSVILKFKPGKTLSSNQDLFNAIQNRQTNRYNFQNKDIDKETVKNLVKTDFADVKITPLYRAGDKEKLAKLVYESDLLWFHKNDFVEELKSWLRSDISTKKDGLPHDTYIKFKTDAEILKKAQHEAKLALSSPLNIIVSSSSETIRNWIHVGEAFEVFALKLTSVGLVNGYFNNPVQLITILKKLNLTFKLKGSAQLILRVGYPTQTPIKSKRRPLATFIANMS